MSYTIKNLYYYDIITIGELDIKKKLEEKKPSKTQQKRKRKGDKGATFEETLNPSSWTSKNKQTKNVYD